MAFVSRWPTRAALGLHLSFGIHKGLLAYINRCAHLALELDWDRGVFFDVDQNHLICATHGALYAAATGDCISGPCSGSGLGALKVLEIEGTVYLRDPRYVGVCREAKAGG